MLTPANLARWLLLVEINHLHSVRKAYHRPVLILIYCQNVVRINIAEG